MRDSLTALTQVDPVQDGLTALQSAVATVKTDLQSAATAVADELKPSEDQVQSAFDQLETSLQDVTANDLAASATEIGTALTEVGTALTRPGIRAQREVPGELSLRSRARCLVPRPRSCQLSFCQGGMKRSPA